MWLRPLPEFTGGAESPAPVELQGGDGWAGEPGKIRRISGGSVAMLSFCVAKQRNSVAVETTAARTKTVRRLERIERKPRL